VSTSAAIRYPIKILGAVVINLLLFTAIQLMVINRQMSLTDKNEFDIASFIRMQEQSREVRSRRDPKAPQKPKAEAQQDVKRLTAVAKSGTVSGLNVSMPEIDIDIEVGGEIQIARELTPLVRIPPEYPHSALLNETEGYVILMFTVTETGSVADPEIIASEPPGTFDRAAIKSVLRWKYQPQLANGKPISVVTKTRIRFSMEGMK
jgi:protein TonB